MGYPPPLLGSSDKSTYSESEWEIVYFLAAYGGVFYAVTLASFPYLMYHVYAHEAWSPLKVKQRGLTQLGAAAGLLWYLHCILVTQMPETKRNKIFPPHTVTCWLRALWEMAGVSVYANCIMVKQYKSYVKYVSRDTRLPTYVYMLVASVPYAIMVLLPVWNRYDEEAGQCREPELARILLYVWTAGTLVASAVLLNTLRDTCTFYPNFQASLAEVLGLVVVLALFGLQMWLTCDGGCPSYVTRATLLTFALVTVPNAVYWICLGQAMWKVVTNDEAYCRSLERLCSPASHLIRPSIVNDTDLGRGGQLSDDNTYHTSNNNNNNSNNNNTNNFNTVPSSDSIRRSQRHRPNYDKGSCGEFFETDRLAKLIDEGSTEAVRAFVLATNLDLVHILDREGLAPLHRAVKTNSIDLAAFLLEINCDPNLPSRDGERAVHFAARNGNADLIAILHEANADVNALTHRGGTPLSYAVIAGSLDATAALLSRGALPCIPGAEVVSSSIGWEKAHVADAGRLKMHWKCPLVLAAELGRADVAACLLDSPAASVGGSNINEPCPHGLTPLTVAVVLGHCAVVELLLHRGADIWFISSREKRTVLHFNAIQGSCAMFKMLRSWFFKVSPPDTTPRSPVKSCPQTPTGKEFDRSPMDASSPPVADMLSPMGGAATEDAGSVDPSFPGSSSTGMPDVLGDRGTGCEASSSLLRESTTPTDDIDTPGAAAPPLWSAPADPKQLLAVFLSMPDFLGRTPLHYAVLNGNEPLVSLLVSEGATTRVKDIPNRKRGCLGMTPGEYAHKLQASQRYSADERAKFYKVWIALQPRTASDGGSGSQQ